MAKQTKKQKQAAQLNAGNDQVIWRGQLCQIIGNEDVTQSSGEVVLCAKIKVLGMPMHQGLRFVPVKELSRCE